MKLNNHFNLKNITLLIIFSTFILFTTSCEKDPVAPAEHFEPVGIILKDATKGVFMKIYEGKIDTNYNKEFVLEYDQLTDNESEEYEIEFLDKDGKEMEQPTSSNYKLNLVFADKTVAELYQHEGEKWAFHIKALKKGETTFEIHILHVDHTDFRTPALKLNIK